MKRLIAAVSFAVLATPVLADNGAPYEQTQFDRGLSVQSDNASSGASANGVWSDDYNFIAPAQ